MVAQPLIDLLKLGSEKEYLASGCYSAAVGTLMNQLKSHSQWLWMNSIAIMNEGIISESNMIKM